MPAVLSTDFEAARCGQLPRIALWRAIEDGPRRAAGSRGVAEDQAVVGLIRPGHGDFEPFVVGNLPDAEGHWLILRQGGMTPGRELADSRQPRTRPNHFALATSFWNRGFLRSGSKFGSIVSQPGERMYGIFNSGSSLSRAFSGSSTRI
jgi:hypothetical protein